jgi:hypothetical protein
MAQKKINYLARTFDDYRTELIKFSNEYYPELSESFNDASVGSWFIDLVSAVGDDLSYYIDRAYQETNINSLTTRSAALNLARSNGLKVPGPKAGVCEVELSCVLPVNPTNIAMPDWSYAPLVKRTTVVAAGSYSFELEDDVNFGEQFNSDGFSNRRYVPMRDENAGVTGYTVYKSAIVSAGVSKIYKKVVAESELEPFMEVVLPDQNIMAVDSIIFKETADFTSDPMLSEFFYDDEEYRISGEAINTFRFFEVNSLADQYRFGVVSSRDINYDDIIVDKYNPVVYEDVTETVEETSGDAMEYLVFNCENGVGKVSNTSNYQILIVYSEGEGQAGQTKSVVVEPGTTVDISTCASEFVFELTDLSVRSGNATANTQNGSVSAEEGGARVDASIKSERKDTYAVNIISASFTNGGEGASTRSQKTTRYYRGKWKPVTQKFITEYTDNGYMKIIFGSGVAYDEVPSGQTVYADYRMSKIINNDMLGVLPRAGWAMYVLYKVGGGVSTNVAQGAINNITLLNVEWPFNAALDPTIKGQILNSMSVSNSSTSIGGKDAPTTEEIKYLIKYNTSSQQRCVTVKDYKARLMMMPPKFGAPFRSNVIEENNKIVMALLGLNADGKLDSALPKILVDNIIEYMSHFKTINDYIEIKSGKIYNVGFLADVFIDKNYNTGDVIRMIIDRIYAYMAVNDRDMGDDIFLGDLEKELNLIDGVISLIDLRVYNLYGGDFGYSPDRCPLPERMLGAGCNQTVDSPYKIPNGTECFEIDLEAIDHVLYGDYNAMYEIYDKNDIQVRVKLK